jgi:coenzyme F420 hydrogenase subunit beta
LLTRATDKVQHEKGQDGGFVSAMLIWLMENDYIEGALVSGVEVDDAWKAKPALARNKEEVLATAGSRYTYCANPLALREAKEQGLTKLALVGMGCQTSSPPVMWERKAGKVGKPFLFNIGLLCSKTFDDAIFEELFEAKYGLKKQDMVKMNIKGAFQIWRAAPTLQPNTPISQLAESAKTTTGLSPLFVPNLVKKLFRA